MFENLTAIAILMFVLWVGGFVAYLISSRRQRDIEVDINQLNDQLTNGK